MTFAIGSETHLSAKAGRTLVAGAGLNSPAIFFNFDHEALNDLSNGSRLVFIGRGNIAYPFIYIPCFHETEYGTDL